LELDRIDYIKQISETENDILTAPFSEEKVKVAIFQMEHNKAPGSDGFPTGFYQIFWDIIKDDLMTMFQEFHSRDLPLFSLNFGVITNRINLVANHIISPTQTAFMRG
jgi:hypothetical protein